MKKIQSCVAAVLALFGVLALAGVIHLAFVFPKTVAVWADEGRALSVVQQALVNLSSLCKSLGLLLVPVLLLAIVGCGVWAVLAGAAVTKESANQETHGTQ